MQLDRLPGFNNPIQDTALQPYLHTHESLLEEIFFLIFRELNALGFQQAALTCKSWNVKCITFAQREEISIINDFIRLLIMNSPENMEELLAFSESTKLHTFPNLCEIRPSIIEIRKKTVDVLKIRTFGYLTSSKHSQKIEKTPKFFDIVFDIALLYRKFTLATTTTGQCEIAKELAELGCYDEALNIVSPMQSYFAYPVYEFILDLLLKRSLFDKAFKFVVTISMVKAYCQLFTTLMEQGLFDKAIFYVKDIKEDRWKVHAIYTLIETLMLTSITEHHRNEIFSCINTFQNIKDPEFETANYNFARLLIKSTLHDKSIIHLDKALDLLPRMIKDNKVYTVYHVCETLQKLGELDKAITVSELIKPGDLPNNYKNFYDNLVQSLARAGRYAEATAVANKSSWKSKSLQYIFFQRSIHEAKAREDGQDKWIALSNISRELAAHGYKDESIEVVQTIEDDKIKSLAVQVIYNELKVQHKIAVIRTIYQYPESNDDLAKTLHVANLIPDDQIRSYALRDFAKYLNSLDPSKGCVVAKENYDKATTVANTIPDDKIREHTLLELAEITDKKYW